MTDPQALADRLEERELATEIERGIRIALWNVARRQGQSDEVAFTFIRYVMEEPSMVRAMKALRSYREVG